MIPRILGPNVGVSCQESDGWEAMCRRIARVMTDPRASPGTKRWFLSADVMHRRR